MTINSILQLRGAFLAVLATGVACSGQRSRSRDSAALQGVTQTAARPKHLVKAIYVGTISFPLDSTVNFEQVKHSLGPTPTSKPVDHDDSWKLCYQLPNSKDAKYVIFESDEIGGPDHRVLGAQLLTQLPKQMSVRCSPTAAHVESASADNGVRIGMPRTTVDSLMGSTPTRTPDEDSFVYHETVTTSPGDSARHVLPTQYEIGSSCKVTFVDGNAVAIRLWYVETS